MRSTPKGQGSLRDVRFFTVEDDATFGRRQPTYSLPFSDRGALSVDLGRAPREFRIHAVVVDRFDDQGRLLESFEAQRDALIEAAEAPGSGLLVHPRYGRVNVIVQGKIRVRHNTRALGKAEIEFSCIEHFNQDGTKAPQQSPAALAQRGAARVHAAAADVLANPATGLVPSEFTDFVKSAHLDVLDKVLTDLREINGAVSVVGSVPSGFAAQIDALSASAAQLILTPRTLWDSVAAVFDKLGEAMHRVVDATGVLVEHTETTTGLVDIVGASRGALTNTIPLAAALGSDVAPVPELDTAERRAQRQGQAAILATTRAGMLASIADAATHMRYDNAADARVVRDAITNALVDLADADDTENTLSDALHDTAAGVQDYLTQLAGRLAEITTFKPAATIPIEVLAYMLYGDAERSDEIIKMNRAIAHPAAVQGLVALEVKAR
jgi:prophage DNA circulation protein